MQKINCVREATELVDKVEKLFHDSRENLECDFAMEPDYRYLTKVSL